jgi:hypothetical protein
MKSVAIAFLVQGTKNEKEIILKKEQYEDGKIVVGFWLFLGRSRSINVISYSASSKF